MRCSNHRMGSLVRHAPTAIYHQWRHNRACLSACRWYLALGGARRSLEYLQEKQVLKIGIIKLND